jgi:hypothetical protein
MTRITDQDALCPAHAKLQCRRQLSAGTSRTKEYSSIRRRGVRGGFQFRVVAPLPLERLLRLRGCHFLFGRAVRACCPRSTTATQRRDSNRDASPSMVSLRPNYPIHGRRSIGSTRLALKRTPISASPHGLRPLPLSAENPSALTIFVEQRQRHWRVYTSCPFRRL